VDVVYPTHLTLTSGAEVMLSAMSFALSILRVFFDLLGERLLSLVLSVSKTVFFNNLILMTPLPELVGVGSLLAQKVWT
jgi:hypothetical protein